MTGVAESEDAVWHPWDHFEQKKNGPTPEDRAMKCS